MNTTKITGAHAVLKSLVEENVKTIFGYPGGAIMPIYDALYDYTDRIKHVLVRHEQGAAHAADAGGEPRGGALAPALSGRGYAAPTVPGNIMVFLSWETFVSFAGTGFAIWES